MSQLQYAAAPTTRRERERGPSFNGPRFLRSPLQTLLSTSARTCADAATHSGYGVSIFPFACRESWSEKLTATMISAPKMNVNAK